MFGARKFAAAAVLALAPVAAPAAFAQEAAPAVPAVVAPAAAPPAAAHPAGLPPLAESVSAIVNDDAISTYDLRQRMRLLAFSSGVQLSEESAPELAREAMRGLIDERLQSQEIARTEARQKNFKIRPTGPEIDEEVANLAKQYNVPAPELLRSLAAAGVDAQTLRNEVASQAAWRRYIQARYQDVHIGDDQINSTLERIAANADKPQYLVSEIFVDAARAGGQAQAEQGARELVEQIRAGASFTAVARQFSSLPTAVNGGDAGWLVSGQMQPFLEKALEPLRPGQVADPIPVKDGVFILQLRDRRAGATAVLVSLKQAAIRLPQEASPEVVAAAQAKLVALKEAAGVCKNLDAEAEKVEGVVAADLGEASVEELSADFRKVVDDMKTGDIGGPVRTAVGLQLIGVCGRRSGGAQQPTRVDIENRLYGEQLDMLARRFLRDLRNSASIETR